MLTNSLSQYLKMLRKSKKLTLLELAELSGVSNTYISQIENGKFTPSLDTLLKLSIGLNENLYIEAIESGIYDSIEEQILKRQFVGDADNSYELSLKSYKDYYYVKLEDILENHKRNFYIADHRLTNSEIHALIEIFKNKDQTYPDEAEIFKSFKNKIKE